MKRLLSLFLVTAALLPLEVEAQQRIAPNTLSRAKISFADAVRQVSPAVVNIYTAKVVQNRVNDPFFEMFFGQAMPGISRERVEQSLGSGVVVRADGIAVTNYHVIKDATEIRVVFNDGRELPARILDADPQMDIAVIQVQLPAGDTLPFVRFGDSSSLEVGDVVLALGNPFGVGQSVSMGIVSALGRTTAAQNAFADFIQTDAAINPGNSGGALVDSYGNLVGINSAIYTRGGGSNGIGFAVPANAVRAVVESVLMTGEVRKAWFGAQGQDLNMPLAGKLGLRSPNGVLINEIFEGSPASRGGLRIGDVILAFEDQTVTNTKMLDARVASAPATSSVRLRVWREGREIELVIPLQPLPERRQEDRFTITGDSPLAGYQVENISPTLAQEFSLPYNTEGVMITGIPNQTGGLDFYGRGMQIGDILTSINRQEIQTLNHVREAVRRRPRSWEIVYKRGSRVFRAVLQ